MAYYIYLNHVRYPVAPSEIKIRIKGNNKTVNMIDGGEVNILKDAHLTEYNFTLLLPNQKYSFATYREKDGGFHQAGYYVDLLDKLKGCNHFKMTITRNDPATNELLWKTIEQVAIEDMTFVEDAGANGTDVEVQLTLKKYVGYGPVKVTVKEDEKAGTTTVTTTQTKEEKKKKSVTYKVKKGDTLQGIAKTYFGDSSKWETIYKDNKTVIEQVAKDNGRKSSSKGKYIYPGTKLIINCG